MKKIFYSTLIVGVLLFICPQLLLATSVKFSSFNKTGSMKYMKNGSWKTVLAGEMGMVLLDDQGNQMNNGKILPSFCVEVGANISIGNVVGPPTNPSDYLNEAGLEAAWLFDTYYEESFLSDENMTALQMAIWETIKDTDHDLLGGNFEVDPNGVTPAAAFGIADGYLDALDLNFPGLSGIERERLNREYQIFSDGLGRKQDQIVRVVGEVPEPATMILFGLGLAGIGFRNRKARKE